MSKNKSGCLPLVMVLIMAVSFFGTLWWEKCGIPWWVTFIVVPAIGFIIILIGAINEGPYPGVRDHSDRWDR